MSLLHVKRAAPALVRPSGPTPSGDLPLSVVDRCPHFMYLEEMMMVFDKGSEPAQVIREALAKALVPYYPVAGRLANVSDGEVGVACTGEGVWFVEATSDCRLEDVDYLTGVPFNFSKEEILPFPPQGIDELALPFMMQVTQFKCGGFVVGVKSNHAVFDGVGAGQFIVAIADMAIGLDEPTIKPIWCRDVFRFPVSHIPDDDSVWSDENPTKLKFCAIDIPIDRIYEKKVGFEDAAGEKFTIFEVVAAKIWQSRTRAINLEGNANVCLGFIANVRHLHDELPTGEGYYGNCTRPVLVNAQSEHAANAPLLDLVRMIKDAKESLPGKYLRFLKGLDVMTGPIWVPSYENLFLMDYRRLGFCEADFGWGAPRLVVVFNEHCASCGDARIMKSPLSARDIRVMIHCVAEEHYEAFLREMNNWS